MRLKSIIARIVLSSVLTVILTGCSGSTLPQLPSSPADQSTQQLTSPPATPPVVQKFDGHALYKATFEALRDRHIALTDTAARAKWVAEWENKHATDGALDTEEGADKACVEMMRSLKQRFDYYLVPAKTAQEQHDADPSFAGTGLVVTIGDATVISSDHPFIVKDVTEGSPASKQDIRKKDRITHIDGKPVEGMTLADAVALLRGKKGVPVVLAIERGSGATTQKLTVTIVRADYIRPVVHFKDLGNGISYIKLDDFSSKYSVREMFEALKLAAKGKALILDLRGNLGGNLAYVEAMAQFFLEDGTINELHARVGDELVTKRLFVQPQVAFRSETVGGQTNIAPEDRMLNMLPNNMPVVVLIDGRSYSASEILAGALQKSRNATVVGVATGGKGVGQNVLQFPFGRSAHITSFEFLPAGIAMDWVGIVPNIEVLQSATFDVDDPSTDAQLTAAKAQAQLLVDAQIALEKKRSELRKKNEDAFQKQIGN